MIVRVALAMLVAVALVAVSTPAVEDARTTRSAEHVRTELGGLERAIHGLAAEEDATTGPALGPRRVRQVTIPRASFATAPIEWVALGGYPDEPSPRDRDDTDVLVAAIEGGPTVRVVVAIDLRMIADGSVHPDDEPLVLGPGRHRLTLTLIQRGGRPTVLVGDPEV